MFLVGIAKMLDVNVVVVMVNTEEREADRSGHKRTHHEIKRTEKGDVLLLLFNYFYFYFFGDLGVVYWLYNLF